MLNEYTDYGDFVAIHADGASKYGLNILINNRRFALVNQATNGYWQIDCDGFNYIAYTINNKNIIYMHDLLTGINNELIEERFINGLNSSKMVTNPFKGQTSLVRHKNGNGLVNVDDNLIVTSSDVSSNESYSEYLKPILLFIDGDDIYNSSLQTILNSEDEITKEENIKIFKAQVLSLANDSLFKRVRPDIKGYIKLFELYEQNKLTGDILRNYDDTLQSLCEEFNNISLMYESDYCFPGHIVMLYPNIRVRRALKEHLCSFSGAKIYKGEEYISYKLFIEDLTEHALYTLAGPIAAEIGYEEYFPKNIKELDDFIYKISHAYELNLDDYYNFATNIKSDNLGIKLIKKERNNGLMY